MKTITELLFRPIEFVFCLLFDVGCSITTCIGETLAKLVKIIFRFKQGSK